MPSGICPDCASALHQIVIVDEGPRGQRALEYRHPTDKPSAWTGRSTVRGQVLAFLCEGCRRIYLYGADYEEERQRRALQEGTRGAVSMAEATGALSPPEDD